MRRPAVFALLVVIGFLALLLLPDLLIKSKSDFVIESVGIVERVVITLLAVVVLAVRGWTADAGVRNPGSLWAWAIVLPPLVYLVIVFPYLFTHSWAPNMRDPKLTALVGVDALMSGVVEEFVFRALIFLAFVQAWGRTRSAIVKAGVASSLFFALPHLTNMLFGQQPLRVFAQVGWAFVLGIAVAWLYYAGASIWPAAFLHGVLDALVATNRMGMKIQITPMKGLVMFSVSLPVLVYAWFVLRGADVSSAHAAR
ncbi:MAG TPA: CPBP family intramembrane glutamic endopeptidase [Thermoanaerobaculia bacterium]|nr:CPBP family intramembrane glutamic endopeptidase [Thermoanaerobaculia bacterium]